ncbi:ferritin-like domain-containing protein [Streptomyces sp. NPDC007088]|uniref:ferritin-like domain-containing protein n=1 Tax=Streptomyces sp. NPDC007088 TaxID=3364773 RepID=UPI0036986FB8
MGFQEDAAHFGSARHASPDAKDGAVGDDKNGAESGRDTARLLRAVQAALRAEHAAVYGYGVVGGRVHADRRGDARAAFDAHRARRDELERTVRDLGGTPEPAAAAYALPFAVANAAAAVRLAVDLEDKVAGVYSDLVRASAGQRRRDAAAALRESAVRSARWRGGSVAFPGLAERSVPATGASVSPAPGPSTSRDG